jgi:hypothetical protein
MRGGSIPADLRLGLRVQGRIWSADSRGVGRSGYAMDLRQPFHTLVVAVVHRRTASKWLRMGHGSVGGPMSG